ncbi:treble-clef zinc-finger protein [Kribbella voronezhensis]|uniref:Treble-clef zinc-finger protein n=1 Tax=Kribbella voronezhensis TaxID=2512212 RepID=A0A4R7SWJ6_9ACTN|nr:FBP domain-containing protein [Kribbella voronezhensis]TDU83219.1 treble-clef zinc-finger protein [Kribbella voronezhensis]
MEPVSAAEIRGAFVNSTKSLVKAMTLPRDFDELPWESLDYLGWRDPKAPARAYLVVPRDGGVAAIALGTAASGKPRRGTGLCDLCHTAHQVTDVALFAARRAGSAGRAGNTVGTYICADLACSLYVRGLRDPEVPQGETVAAEVRVDRLGQRLDSFVGRVLA